jgi:hypothetical protein
MSLPFCGMFLRRNIGLDRLFNIPSNIRLRDIFFVNMNGVSYSQLIDGAGGKCENIRSVVTTASGNQYPFPTPNDITLEQFVEDRDKIDDAHLENGTYHNKTPTNVTFPLTMQEVNNLRNFDNCDVKCGLLLIFYAAVSNASEFRSPEANLSYTLINNDRSNRNVKSLSSPFLFNIPYPTFDVKGWKRLHVTSPGMVQNLNGLRESDNCDVKCGLLFNIYAAVSNASELRSPEANLVNALINDDRNPIEECDVKYSLLPNFYAAVSNASDLQNGNVKSLSSLTIPGVVSNEVSALKLATSKIFSDSV